MKTPDRRGEIALMMAPVKNGERVTGSGQAPHGMNSDQFAAADEENAHPARFYTRRSVATWPALPKTRR